MSEKIISVTSVDENNAKITKAKTVTQGGNAGERKTLRTLQLSSDGKLIGSQLRNSPVKKSSKITPFKKPLTIYADKKPSPVEAGVQTDAQECVETGAQTEISGATGVGSVGSDLHNDSGVFAGDAEREAYDLMVKDEVPESYWRDLAEERRLSLAEALSENEMLHQSMEELKEENLNLSQMAGQAEYFANLLNEALNDRKTEENDTEPSEESTNDKDTEDTNDKETQDSNDNDSQSEENSNDKQDSGLKEEAD